MAITGEMEEYLKPTKLVDLNSDIIMETMNRIIKYTKTLTEVASKIFYFVRDEIPFGMDYLDVTASHTLIKRVGYCTAKVNLQIALLRAAGIPARCHYVRAKKEFLKNIIFEFLYNKFPMVVGHLWCECYLAGRWVACEALFDEALFKGMLKKGLVTEEQIPTIDWDADTNLILLNPWIVEDVGTFFSLDDVIREMVRRGEKNMPSSILDKLFGWFVFFLSNWYTNSLRIQKKFS